MIITKWTLEFLGENDSFLGQDDYQPKKQNMVTMPVIMLLNLFFE